MFSPSTAIQIVLISIASRLQQQQQQTLNSLKLKFLHAGLIMGGREVYIIFISMFEVLRETRAHTCQQIYGWIVIEPACHFMNKSWNCSPSDGVILLGINSEGMLGMNSLTLADPKRKQDWTRLEHAIDFQVLLNAYHMEPEDDWSDDNLLDERDWMMMEHERELEDILSEMFSESEDA